MVKIYLGIGSNIQPEKNIRAGINSLESLFTELEISPTYLAEPFGFDGDDFHNLVVAAETALSITDVVKTLREIEYDHGRPEQAVKFSSRSLDIDLLLYGDFVGTVAGYKIPRADIDKFDFVLRPLQDIAGDVIHPVSKKNFSQLWSDMRAHSSLELI